MLIQSTLPSSIEEALSFVSDHRKEDLLFDWIPSGENWQKCPKCEECPRDGCREPISTREEKEIASSHYLNHSRTWSKVSTSSNMCASAVPNLVYRRRKLQRNSVALLSAQEINCKGSGGCLSNMGSDEAPTLAAENDDHLCSQIHNEIDCTRACVTAAGAHNKDLCCGNISTCEQFRLQNPDDVTCTKMKKIRGLEVVSKSESINGYLGGEEQGFYEAPNNNISKSALEYHSVNDSCSSSKSNNMDRSSASLKTDLDDTAECSSSDILTAELLGGSLPEKELCISILRSHGLLGGVLPTRSRASVDILSVNSDTNHFQPCKICGHSENTLKMLICDNCEEAVHVSCCNPRIKKIPVEEWYCQPCSRKKRKLSLQTTTGESFNVKSKVSKCRNRTSKGESGPISFMLKDSEPYTTGVRIGKAFQAEVPDWTGPILYDFDCFGEPLEMDTTGCDSLYEWNCHKSSTTNSIGNWLQCREVLDENTGEGAEGTICGKWRRAPLFEVQTDDWDCSCCVLWDPIHSDCAVPQELETDQVLMHLKYVELLRPRLTAKKRKPSLSKSDTEDIRNVASKHGDEP